MDINKLLLNLLYLTFIDGFVIKSNSGNISEESSEVFEAEKGESDNPAKVFNGVYAECFFKLSYTCLQKKTLLYLRELNRLNEISVIGEYVKFVKLNTTESFNYGEEYSMEQSSDELAYMIDKAVDNFFDNHLIRFSALGKDVLVPNKVEEFVGRKRRKGGGGGGGGHGGGDDGGKKKMMMMAMMCMKMKLMMMVPAMMGMMGMMSFKGMMFSMMSFMISKMMLLMKILEKKGGGGGGGGGGDWGWAAGGGGGGAWMPAGPDYGGGGGGGGYDANGQWQSRSIIENAKDVPYRSNETPLMSYAKPIIRYSKINDALVNKLNDEVTKSNREFKLKSRKKRGIIDVLQNAYIYWTNKVLGIGNKKPHVYPKYKLVNGVKFVYYPVRSIPKGKAPKELQANLIKGNEEVKPVVIVDDFNKGEIVEGPIESRMIRKKLHKMKENVKDTVEENPWE